MRSQGFGVFCGLSTVVLLAVGSFALALGDPRAKPPMDDLRLFFEAPSPSYLWLYLLAVVVVLYAASTTLATIHSLGKKLRAGARGAATFAPAVVHLGFLLALAAHLASGFGGRDLGEVVLRREWTPISEGRRARLVSLDVDVLPGGMPKEVRAKVEVKLARGETRTEIVGYNAPLSTGFGSDLWLLSEQGEDEAGPAILLSGRRAPGHPLALASAIVLAVGLAMMWRRFVPTGA